MRRLRPRAWAAAPLRLSDPEMEIGLCMIVRDEVGRIADCLDPIVDLLTDIVIVDTGSIDGTPTLLATRYGIDVLRGALDGDNCNSKAPARNQAHAAVHAPWILSLDADERLARADLQALLAMPDDPALSGYFFPWHTYRGDCVVEDYKLCLYRHGLRSTGCAHENVQVDLRARELDAAWIGERVVRHLPDPAKDAWKLEFYTARMTCAIARDPQWFRYHWFLGYTFFRQGLSARALPWLRTAADAESTRFPVECLNSAMLLAGLLAAQGESAAAVRTIARAREFHARVQQDCEVRVNFRMKPWLDAAAAELAERGALSLAPYSFAY